MKNETKEIGEIMNLLHDTYPNKGDKFFNSVVDKLLDSDKEVVKNYLVVLKKLIEG